MKQITKHDLETRWTQYLNVGRLKQFIEDHDIPDTAKVLIQRVPDMYYEGFDISGIRGPGGVLPPGSKSEGWPVYTKLRGTDGESEYSPAWCCVSYNDDKENLFIDLHY